MINLRFKEFYEYHIRVIRSWLLDVGIRYRTAGLYRGFPFVLADRYPAPADQETALFSGILVPPRGELKDRHFNALQEVMGAHPSEWFEDRLFTMMSAGANLSRQLPDINLPFWAMARLYAYLWDMAHCVYRRKDGSEVMPKSLENRFLLEMQDRKVSASDLMAEWLTEYIGPRNRWKSDLLVWRLFGRTDFGLGLWGKGTEKLPWIWDNVSRAFIDDWIPDWRYVGNRQDMAYLFYEDALDFFYLAHGWAEVKRRQPRESARLLYHSQCGVINRTFQSPSAWKSFMFDAEL